MLAIFVAGLLSGAGLLMLGMSWRAGRHATPVPVLTLATQNTAAPDVVANATIPPIARTASDFEPVYLTDTQVANLERVRVGGTDPKAAHEPIQAERR